MLSQDNSIRAAQRRVANWMYYRGYNAINDMPVIDLPPDEIPAVSSYLREEARELDEELFKVAKLTLEGGQYDEVEMLADVAKEAADVLFTVFGVCNVLGIDLQSAFDAVCESNETKPAVDWRATKGMKIPKGDFYVKPDIKKLIEEQRKAFVNYLHNQDEDNARVD